MISYVFSKGEGNMKLHVCVAAYISDYSFLGTTMMSYPAKRVKMMASLDHAMWFHNTFRADEWMLYEVNSPWAGQCVACDFLRFHFYNSGTYFAFVLMNTCIILLLFMSASQIA